VRFHNIEHDLDALSQDVARVFACVADMRAATPSAAAEHAVPALADLRAALRSRHARLVSATTERAGSAKADLSTTARGLRTAALRLVEKRRAGIGGVAGRLNALSPLAILSRGYAVARRPDGETLSRAAQFIPGEPFDLLLHDGVVGSRAEDIKPGT